MTPDRLTHALEDVLNRQADCLRRGDMAAALDMAPGLERLVNGLAHARSRRETSETIDHIRSLADRNAALIEAARDGVAAARALLDQPPQEGFEGYDAMGRPLKIGDRAPARREIREIYHKSRGNGGPN
ncbi:hypothetical protein HKCCE3408_12335 [Rhodobacterales bacterium HKCCE3408]|nr:hypothetical protein [Rhodobacterales bacterium HKCCE3408]